MKKVSGLSNWEYHHGEFKDFIGSTGLKNILVSPEYFKSQQNNPMQSTASMNLGAAVHTVILEPNKFQSEIVVMPKFSGTGSVKKKADFIKGVMPEQTVITEDQAEIVRGIRDKYDATPELVGMLSGGEAEVSIFWGDYKVRPDYLKDGIVYDLKTTSAPLNEFSKACANYMYDLSAWLYQYGAQAQQYKFVVVETKPPYNFVVYEPDTEFMHEGRDKALSAMDTLSECKKYNIWPGVELFQPLSLPSWYVR